MSFGAGKNGFNHLYAIPIESRQIIALTCGKWNDIDYKVDDSGQHIFFTSTKDIPNEHHLYSISITNGKSVDFIFYPCESDCIKLDGSYINLFQKVCEYFERNLKCCGDPPEN